MHNSILIKRETFVFIHFRLLKTDIIKKHNFHISCNNNKEVSNKVFCIFLSCWFLIYQLMKWIKVSSEQVDRVNFFFILVTFFIFYKLSVYAYIVTINFV